MNSPLIDSAYQSASAATGEPKAHLAAIGFSVFGTMLYHAADRRGETIWTATRIEPESGRLSVEVDYDAKFVGRINTAQRLAAVNARLACEITRESRPGLLVRTNPGLLDRPDPVQRIVSIWFVSFAVFVTGIILGLLWSTLR